MTTKAMTTKAMTTQARNHRFGTLFVGALCAALLCQVQCIVGDDPAATNTASDSLSDDRADRSYTRTQYPIVLVHGIVGFDDIGGLINYFHRVPYNLERSGARVYVSQVSFFNDSEVRGEQLADYIASNIPEPKVNIFAHSQGSPTARAAASFIPDRVASITSINGVNKGSRVADVVRGVVPVDSRIEGGVGAIANALGSMVDLLSGGGHAQDAVAALDTLTTPGTADLNTRHGWGVDTVNYCGSTAEDVDVLGHDIKMFSWVGTNTFTNVFDALDPFLVTTSLVFGEPSDGLVGRCSQYLGNVVYDNQSMNHLDAVNQLFGIHSVWLDPITLYRAHANRLKNRGL